jgi:hypothetical protein
MKGSVSRGIPQSFALVKTQFTKSSSNSSSALAYKDTIVKKLGISLLRGLWILTAWHHPVVSKPES